MRTLVVLGAGTAGTMVVNKLRHRLPTSEWRIVVVDRDDVHDYQPGYLFLPFGLIEPEQVRRSRHGLISDGVELVLGDVDRVDPRAREVSLVDGRTLTYDSLVMKKAIAELDVPEVPAFLDQIVGSGGHLWAYRMSADRQHLTEGDLRDDVEGIISASDCIELTEGAQRLFI